MYGFMYVRRRARYAEISVFNATEYEMTGDD